MTFETTHPNNISFFKNRFVQPDNHHPNRTDKNIRLPRKYAKTDFQAKINIDFKINDKINNYLNNENHTTYYIQNKAI